MRSYRERLAAPVSWWIAGGAGTFTFGSLVWFGLPVWVALVTYGSLFAITATFLLHWSLARIVVTGTELVAGRRRLPLAAAGHVRALDEAATRALLGPRADPRAYLLIRPYLRRAVYVEVTGPGGQVPYWLLASRHPADLAAAIETSRVAGAATMG